MRQAGLVVLGIILLVLESVLCRLLHIEVVKPDLILILVVFIALRLGSCSVVTVFILGLCSDAFASTPSGLLTSIYLIVWILMREGTRFVILDSLMVWIITLLGVSIVSGLLIALLEFIMDMETCALRVLTWMGPLVLLNGLMAFPIWLLAERIVNLPHRAIH